jgi:outer membrane protein assembly factor BamB
MVDDMMSATALHVAPGAEKLDVHVNSVFRADFNNAIDPATVNAQTFSLVDPSGAVVPATVTYDAETRSALLRPDSALAVSTRYTAGLTDAIKRNLGLPFSPFSWSFTTAARVTQSLHLGDAADDNFAPLTIDKQNNLLMSRIRVTAGNTSTPTRISVDKYSPDGVLIWTREIVTNESFADTRIVVDTQDNVIVALTIATTPIGMASSAEIRVIKLNGTDGTELWRTVTGTAGNDQLAGLTVDSAGDIYLAAISSATRVDETTPFNEDGLVIKLAGSTAQSVWQSTFGSPNTERCAGIVLIGTGTVLVGGTTDGTLNQQPNAGGTDVFAIRFDATSGAALGTFVFGTIEQEQVHSIVSNGTAIYLFGDLFINDVNGIPDIEGKVWALNTTASQLDWTQTIGGTRLESVLRGVVNATGNLVIAGLSVPNFFGPPPPPPSPVFDRLEPVQFVATLDSANRGAVLWNTTLQGEAEVNQLHMAYGHADLTGFALNNVGNPMVLITVHGQGGFDGLTSAGLSDGFVIALDAAKGNAL